MKNEFEKELTELINKHGMEKVFGDTPDFILAKVAFHAMAVFGEATKERDNWHEFRKADEKSSQDAKHNYPDDCNICKDRFKCADYLSKQPIGDLIKHIRTTQNAEERLAIHRVLQHANNPMVATDKWADEMIKEAVEKLGKCPGEIMGTDILILKYEPKNIL